MDYWSILSGQRRDPLAIFFRLVLWCAQWPYRVIVAIRNRRLDRNDSLIQHADVPVISIGNLTTAEPARRRWSVISRNSFANVESESPSSAVAMGLMQAKETMKR